MISRGSPISGGRGLIAWEKERERERERERIEGKGREEGRKKRRKKGVSEREN